MSRLFENVPMWTRLKCPHLGVAAVAAMPVDGDVVDEREGTKAIGFNGRSEERLDECGGGRTGDGSFVSAGQADLAALSQDGRRRIGASTTRPAWAAPENN